MGELMQMQNGLIVEGVLSPLNYHKAMSIELVFIHSSIFDTSK